MLVVLSLLFLPAASFYWSMGSIVYKSNFLPCATRIDYRGVAAGMGVHAYGRYCIRLASREDCRL